jgi:hypothetical protein
MLDTEHVNIKTHTPSTNTLEISVISKIVNNKKINNNKHIWKQICHLLQVRYKIVLTSIITEQSGPEYEDL